MQHGDKVKQVETGRSGVFLGMVPDRDRFDRKTGRNWALVSWDDSPNAAVHYMSALAANQQLQVICTA